MLYRNDMPNLQILVVFEASARLLSFTAAARELGATQSAVSQQMKGLEEWVGVPLFERIYRGVALTDEGEYLLETTQKSLGELRRALHYLREKTEKKTLRFATDFAFASYWLMPILAKFRQAHPDIDFRIETSQSPTESITRDVDLAIVFGDGMNDGDVVKQLFKEQVYPVCSPQFLTSYEMSSHVKKLSSLPLLKLKGEPHSKWLTWEQVLEKNNQGKVADSSSMVFDNYTLVVQAAIAGQGVALGWVPLLDSLIESGVLVKLDEVYCESNNGYHLVVPGLKGKTEIQIFLDWLDDYLVLT